MKAMKKCLTLAAVAVLALTCFTGCGKKKIDVLSGMEVNFSGVDGKGRAEVVFPDAELGYGFLDDLVFGGDEEFESFADLARLDKISNAVTYEVKPDQELSNGDKVTVEVTVNSKTLKELGYKAQSASKTFKVKGLAEPVKIDPFKDFDVTFSGTEPWAKAVFETSREVDGATVYYTCENNGSLRRGDTATIKASVYNPDMYILTKETKDFTVEGVDFYVAHADDIPDAMWEALKAQTSELWEEETFERYYQWNYTGFDYVGYEFHAPKDGGINNSLYLVYEVTAEDEEGAFSYYFFYKLEHLLVKADGTWEANTPIFSKSTYSEFERNDHEVDGMATLQRVHEEIAEREDPKSLMETDLPQ